MSRHAVNCGSTKLTECRKRIMHYLVKMYHSKSAILCGAKVTIEEDLGYFLTLQNLNYLKLKSKCWMSQDVLLNEAFIDHELGMFQS